MAWRYQPGAHQPGRWLDILRVGVKFQDSVYEEPQPPLLLGRVDRWAVADRIAWGELLLPAGGGVEQPWYGSGWPPSPRALSSSMLTSRATSFSIRIYRRWSSTCPPTGGPPRFAAGAIVAGALVWEGAGDQLLESLQWVADDAQLLLRALLFRAVTDLLHRPHEEPTIVTRPGQPALELALRLAGPDVALPHNPARTASSTSRQTSITWPSRESVAAEDPSRGVPPVTEVRRSSPAGHGRLRFAVPLLRGLPAGPEHGRDLGPGVSVVSGRGNGVGKLHLGSRSGTDRGSKAPQMRRVSVRGRDRCRIQGVEPPLGVIGGLLQLCAGAGHGHHLVVWSRAGSQLFVELAAEGHRVDGHRLAVVVEDDDFEEPARTVSTDVEIAVSLVDDAYGVADGVFNVGAVDAVLAGGVRDLHPCRLPCPLDWTT